jgi:4-hydroxybenzoate polyprenyltransferase
MIGFFKLIRFPNLIIIVLTQYLFRYCILIPLLNIEFPPVHPVFSHLDFALLVFATVLIAAAGYAINDYFDIRIDHINKPEKIIVGRLISRRKAMLTHTIFNIIAVLIGLYLSIKVHNYKLVSIFIVISIFLWLYSLRYKAYFIVGNLIVAFVSAMTILIIWVFEKSALTHNIIFVKDIFHYLSFFLWAYVLYSFFTSLIREIIKDIEDIEGDRKVGCSTLPVVLGVTATKYILAALCVLMGVSLTYICYIAFTMDMTYIFFYLIAFLIIPFFYMAFVIIRAKNKKDYHFLSNMTKFIMISGVISMAVVFTLF